MEILDLAFFAVCALLFLLMISSLIAYVLFRHKISKAGLRLRRSNSSYRITPAYGWSVLGVYKIQYNNKETDFIILCRTLRPWVFSPDCQNIIKIISESAQQGDAPEPATIVDPASPTSQPPAR